MSAALRALDRTAAMLAVAAVVGTAMGLGLFVVGIGLVVVACLLIIAGARE